MKNNTRSASRSPNDSTCSTRAVLTEEVGTRRSKRNCSRVIEEVSNRNRNGVQFNDSQFYASLPHFPSIYKKRRSEKGQNSASQLTTSGVPEKLESGGSEREQTINYLLPFTQQLRPTKKRSRAVTRARDLASLSNLGECQMQTTYSAQRIRNSEQPHTCLESLVSNMQPAIAKRKRNGVTIPRHFTCGLNFPPGTAEDVDSTISITRLAPITPAKAERAENNHVSESQNWKVYDREKQEGNGNEVVVTWIDTNQLQGPTQPDTDSPVLTVSTTAKKIQDTKEGSQKIDLSKTPQQKPNKRKHRPKVVREDKDKLMQTLKPTVTPKLTENPNKPATTPAEVNGDSADLETLEPLATKYSCRLSLKFGAQRQQAQLQKENSTQRPRVGIVYDLSTVCTEVLKDDMSPEVPNVGNSGQATVHGDITKATMKKNTRSASRSLNDFTCSTSAVLTQVPTRRSKRLFSRVIEEANNKNRNGVQFNNLQFYASLLHFPSIYKKRRSERGQNSVSSSTPSCWNSASQLTTSGVPDKLELESGGSQQEQTIYYLWPFTQQLRPTKKRSRGVTRVRDLASFSKLAECQMQTTYSAPGIRNSEQPHTCIASLLSNMQPTVAKRKRSKMRSYTSVLASSCTNQMVLYKHGQSLAKSSGGHPKVKSWQDHVDAVTEQFKYLDNKREGRTRREICQESNRLVPYNEDHNALVFYRSNNTIVPFQGAFSKRRERPKVELDDETNKVWRLLLENIHNEGVDGTDAEKKRWWEEERRAFSGRADSFVARMHLVQGDRRFSRWKGSVVDSVIGVFLTQNVSDHLSSSAFMALAARYSLKSEISDNRLEEEDGTLSVKEPLTVQEFSTSCSENNQLSNLQRDENVVIQSKNLLVRNDNSESLAQEEDKKAQQTLTLPNLSGETLDVTDNQRETMQKAAKDKAVKGVNAAKQKSRRVGKEIRNEFDWDALRREAEPNGNKREKTSSTMDSLDWEAVRCADANEIADTIKERGMNNMLAERIKAFLNRMVKDHGSIDLEWLRDVSPDKANEYLLSIRGLGLKSVECVRLLTLHHLAFPVDTNVGRIAVRLGWVPLQPLPDSLQLHLLELYPVLESIQKYLWPRLCKLEQKDLYELHYQMITFGKVFCTKSKPNCNACPMRGECRHFASALASARLALPPPEEKGIVPATEKTAKVDSDVHVYRLSLPPPQAIPQLEGSMQLEANLRIDEKPVVGSSEPIIEEPASPEPDNTQDLEYDIEDVLYDNPDEIPTIKLNIEEFTQNLQNYMELQEGEMSKALVALNPEVASLPMPKLKNVSRLRTEHQVYELPDSHPLLEGMDKREPDDPCSYLLAICTLGETANNIQPPKGGCCYQESGKLCDQNTCFTCDSTWEANSQMVRGTLLIPCRTAMRGSFPLNGTYFQVNEVFADHDSSHKPIDVPRSWLWNLPRRTVYFGTSVSSICKGLPIEDIRLCFLRGYVCVRGFDQKTRAPRPLMARLHFSVRR